ncbi:uncharacterized protein LOC124279472 [Haliotis rubra]|uniref:uncharacterized protein LOC124279472 n=1 Tax=Haliotis rubra TaxID=36100 RepID=UPI001EE578B4|nr:uncharacterized protein LOC124279472 [Haliotis rubra]
MSSGRVRQEFIACDGLHLRTAGQKQLASDIICALSVCTQPLNNPTRLPLITPTTPTTSTTSRVTYAQACEEKPVGVTASLDITSEVDFPPLVHAAVLPRNKMADKSQLAAASLPTTCKQPVKSQLTAASRPTTCKQPVMDYSMLYGGKHPEHERITFTPPCRPKGTEVYLFSTGGDPNKKFDGRADQYRWKNQGSKTIKAGKQILTKYYFTVDSEEVPPPFSKQEFRHPDIPDLVLVYYKGDHSAYKPKPHGNRVQGNQEHRRTAASVLANARESNKGPSATYRDLVSDPSVSGTLQGILNPRNKKQVRNQGELRRNQQKLNQDTIYSVQELAYHLEPFVLGITTYPDLRIVLALDNIMNDLKVMADKTPATRIILGYDTTFNLGDFYVTTILYHHGNLKKEPVIPLAFLIHER